LRSYAHDHGSRFTRNQHPRSGKCHSNLICVDQSQQIPLLGQRKTGHARVNWTAYLITPRFNLTGETPENLQIRHVYGGAADTVQNRRSHDLTPVVAVCFLLFEFRTDSDKDDGKLLRLGEDCR
jgi:hypothetical protein